MPAPDTANDLQYQNVKAEFFEAIWNVVNQPDVRRRFEQALAGELVRAGSRAPPGQQTARLRRSRPSGVGTGRVGQTSA